MIVVFWAGVLWLGTTIIQGSPNAINFLKKAGKRIFYVTNNSTKTQKELLTKIDSMGFNAAEVCLIYYNIGWERLKVWAWTGFCFLTAHWCFLLTICHTFQWGI